MPTEKEVADALRPIAAGMLRTTESEVAVDVRRVRKGRPPVASAEEVRRAVEEHGTQAAAASALGISERTVRARISTLRSQRTTTGSKKSTRTGKK
jgi:DNA-directed RNA polymerase specialized sigma24 family protein